MAFLAPLAIAGATSAAGTLVNNAMNGSQGQYAPAMAPITNAATKKQANAAYNTSQDALAQQAALLAALRGQNGITNQSDVYNNLNGVANGTGPNPALAMLEQATGQNVAQQAALAAGTRGASSNVGMTQRNAANVGANIQQNAAGQAAVMQANQQLNALNAQGNLATQQVAQQQGATTALNQFGQNEQQLLLQAIANQNNAATANQGNVNNNNANTRQQLITGNQNIVGNMTGAIGAGLNKIATPQPMNLNDTTITSNPNTGGSTRDYTKNLYMGGKVTGPKSKVCQYLKGGQVPGKAEVKGNSIKNDKVKAVLSPGEIVLPRSVTQAKDAPAKAAAFVAAIMARSGKQKAA